MSLIKGNTALQTHEISTKHLCNTETAIKTHWNSTSASYSQIKISNRKSKNSLICFKFVQRLYVLQVKIPNTVQCQSDTYMLPVNQSTSLHLRSL